MPIKLICIPLLCIVYLQINIEYIVQNNPIHQIERIFLKSVSLQEQMDQSEPLLC